jgi:hypothetical protein
MCVRHMYDREKQDGLLVPTTLTLSCFKQHTNVAVELAVCRWEQKMFRFSHLHNMQSFTTDS